MHDSAQTALLGLALLSLIAVCTSNCTFHFDDNGLNAEIEIRIRLQGLENCYSPMFLNINCTFEDSFKSYLDGILNNSSVADDGKVICSTDKFRLFITKPYGNVTIPDLPKSLLEMDISLKHVYLDGLGIPGIPPGFFDSQKTLEVINLRKNDLVWISGTVFDKLTNLKELDLSQNKLTSFFPGDSGSLKNLEILNISFNRLGDIPPSTFKSMESLRELYLNGNHLYHVRTLLLKNLTNLAVLDLSNNMLETLNFGTFDTLKNLKTLNLSNNKFEILPLYTFHAMKNLENLYFSHNQFSELEFEIFTMWQLKNVDFRGNSFSCNFLIGLINYLDEKDIHFEKEAFTEGNNVYGFRCGNLYTLDREAMSPIRDSNSLNYLSPTVKNISSTLNKALIKLDKVLEKLGNTGT